MVRSLVRGSHSYRNRNRNWNLVLVLIGLTKPTTDEHNVIDEGILMDEPRQVPPSLTKASGPFNTTNNTSNSNNNSYADR